MKRLLKKWRVRAIVIVSLAVLVAGLVTSLTSGVSVSVEPDTKTHQESQPVTATIETVDGVSIVAEGLISISNDIMVIAGDK